jgi:hypothetical protein
VVEFLPDISQSFPQPGPRTADTTSPLGPSPCPWHFEHSPQHIKCTPSAGVSPKADSPQSRLTVRRIRLKDGLVSAVVRVGTSYVNAAMHFGKGKSQATDLTIIPFHPNSKGGRERELDRSKALSHAARVVHSRCSLQNSEAGREGEASLTTDSKPRKPVRDVRRRSGVDRPPGKPRLPRSRPGNIQSRQSKLRRAGFTELYIDLVGPGHGNLDPFDCMSVQVTPRVAEMFAT